MTLTQCNGNVLELPEDDYLGDPANHVPVLLNEIEKGLYAPLFEGKSDLVFVDIGANIGLVSLYALPACQRILAVEPDPKTFTELLRRLPQSPVHTLNGALSSRDGPCSFFQNEVNSTASSTVNTHGVQIKVPGYRLRSIIELFGEDKIDVMKIDAEGAEGESLNYDELKHASHFVSRFFVECHNCPNSTWQDKLAKLVHNLTRTEMYPHILVEGTAVHAWK